MKILTVQEVLKNLDYYANKPTYITGLLIYDFECICIDNIPNANTNDDSLWLSCANGLKFNDKGMRSLNYRQVLVEGIITLPEEGFGSGHMSLWSAEIIATDIERYKNII